VNDPRDPANMAQAQFLATDPAERRKNQELVLGNMVSGRGDLESRDGEGQQRNLVPSISEYRALVAGTTPGEGGFTIPSGVSATVIERLVATSALMRIPGLNIVR
jgi:predicted phage gp36 major capsid-like protein